MAKKFGTGSLLKSYLGERRQIVFFFYKQS